MPASAAVLRAARSRQPRFVVGALSFTRGRPIKQGPCECFLAARGRVYGLRTRRASPAAGRGARPRSQPGGRHCRPLRPRGRITSCLHPVVLHPPWYSRSLAVGLVFFFSSCANPCNLGLGVLCVWHRCPVPRPRSGPPGPGSASRCRAASTGHEKDVQQTTLPSEKSAMKTRIRFNESAFNNGLCGCARVICALLSCLRVPCPSPSRAGLPWSALGQDAAAWGIPGVLGQRRSPGAPLVPAAPPGQCPRGDRAGDGARARASPAQPGGAAQPLPGPLTHRNDHQLSS